ncbi:MAG: hypothetical protein A4E61_00124 [Syntrophorhabdus sp. PtaB.Bin184]|nr:MAG: hypothetical protein A4E61_00124 [Syntrophorhabdus sp. PtaB.Bin184]
MSRPVKSRALLLPKAMALPPPDCIWRMKKIQTPMSRSMGNQDMKMDCHNPDSSSGLAVIFTFFSRSVFTRSGSSGAKVLNSLPSLNVPVMFCPCIRTEATLSVRRASEKSLKAIFSWFFFGLL